MPAVNHRLPVRSTMSYPPSETIGYMIGERLLELRTSAGLTQPEFAAIAGTTKQYVGRLEKGFNKDPNPKLVELWARHFGVRMEWITSGKLPKEASVSDDGDWADVVGYSQAVGLGTSGPEAQEYAETHKLHFRRESLRRKHLNPKDLSVMYGKGDSMEPRIQSGDAIMFDTTDTAPKNGGVYVILTGGAAADEYNVKRCKIGRDKRVMFVADNPDGDHDWKEPRWKDEPASPIKIIGRVRWVGGWVK